MTPLIRSLLYDFWVLGVAVPLRVLWCEGMSLVVHPPHLQFPLLRSSASPAMLPSEKLGNKEKEKEKKDILGVQVCRLLRKICEDSLGKRRSGQS